MTRRFALALGVGLVVAAFLFAPAPPNARARRAMGPTQRLFGPLSSVAASVEWVRYTLALTEGDEERAYAHARRALNLDPRSPSGWSGLASHYIFLRGSPRESLTEQERRRWFEAGFDLLAEGEKHVDRPRDLAFESGLIAHYFGTLPLEEQPWTGSRTSLLTRAITDLERAARGRHPDADGVLADARAALAESR